MNIAVDTKKLNLGCGHDKQDGWVNADLNPEYTPDVICDFEKRLSFNDSEFGYVKARQIFEHIVNLGGLMKEIHRVLQMDGVLECSVPMFGCKSALIDPSHVRFFIPETFLMFCNPDFFAPNTYENKGLFDIEEIKVVKWQYSHETVETAGDFFTEIMVKLRKVDKSFWEINSPDCPKITMEIKEWT